MKLIAESGSTKTEWSLIEDGEVVEQVYTEGINPFFQTRREISRSIRLGLPAHFFRKKICMVYYYGAGCASPEKKQMLSASLITQFKTHTQVESDLLAAARGLFLDQSGIACILGTGSNSCFYDGSEIKKNVRSGGYILGDEGSGAALGKEFLSDLLKGLAPESLITEFLAKFRIEPSDILDTVYNHPSPNRFLDTVSYFLTNYIDNTYVVDMVVRNFQRFFSRCIFQYDYQNYPIRFVGSMAINFRDILCKVAQDYGIEISAIEETPMPGLIKFHSTTEV
jgi:N-acetylglucosamine kinase-like BadF-type ATPase